MKRHGGGVRTGGGNQLTSLQMSQSAVDCMREARGCGDRLMGHANRPVRLLPHDDRGRGK